MKKLIWAAAVAAAVFSVSNAEAGPGERRGMTEEKELHGYYRNGGIEDIRHDLLMTANLWKVRDRNHKQTWNTVNGEGENVRVKIKGNDYKDFVKLKADGERAFVKDISPVGKTRHVGKVREHRDRHVMRDVTFENGTDIIMNK